MSKKNRQVTHIKIFVASPEDALKERKKVKEAVERCSKAELFPGYKFEALDWHDTPGAIDPACEKNDGETHIINRTLRDCDLLLVVFKKSLGTPYVNQETGAEYPCATLAELHYHAQLRKKARIYFLDKKKKVFDQYRELLHTKAYECSGLYKEFSSKEFGNRLDHEVQTFFKEYVDNIQQDKEEAQVLLNPPTPEPLRHPQWREQTADSKFFENFNNLSDAAVELICAALDANDLIYKKHYGVVLNHKTNDLPYFSDIDAEDRPSDYDILDELVRWKLLAYDFENSYRVTDYAKTQRELLVERDDKRVIKSVLGPVRFCLQQVRTVGDVIECELFDPNEMPMINIYQATAEERKFIGGSRQYTSEGISHIATFMRRNGLVDDWYLKSSREERGFIRCGFSGAPLKFPKWEGDKGPLNCNWIEATLTERGARIAKFFH